MSGRTTTTFHKRKLCRVQFSLYHNVNIRGFFAKGNQLHTAKTTIGKSRYLSQLSAIICIDY